MRISDWSSDVCSSDLTLAMAQAAIRREVHQPLDVHRGFATKIAFDIMIGVDGFADLEHFLIGQILHAALGRDAQLQIGKRRVGQECVSTCRSRWSPYH